MKILPLFAFLIANAAVQAISAADPAQVGMAEDRLARIAPHMNKQG